MLKELYQYRELLKTNVKKEIRGKYKGSFLGVLWSFINPLLMTLVYAMVFSKVLRSGQENYVTFLIIGILPWNWFTTVIGQGTNTILVNSGIIKKVYFEREILPISIVTSGLVNFLISCIIMFLFIIFTGVGFSWNILWLPVIIVIQYVFTLGLIFITSSIDVYIRDAEYIINFIMMMFFYGTPILYSADIFSGSKLFGLIKLNPMTAIITSYRDILFYKTAPNFESLGVVALLSIVILFIGLAVFKKLKKGFAEEV